MEDMGDKKVKPLNLQTEEANMQQSEEEEEDWEGEEIVHSFEESDDEKSVDGQM